MTPFVDYVLRPFALGLFTYLHLHASFTLAALKRVRARQEAVSEIPDDLPSRLLYLRAFTVDHDPVDFKEPLKAGSIITAPLEPTSIEEDVLSGLPESSPALCLGRPNEKFPSCGAQRIYFSEEDWQDAVRAFVQTCALVLVRTAETPSLVWEISEIVSIASPDRVVLWHSGGETEWERFRLLVDEKFPHSLPQDFRQPGLLRFEAGWVPRWLTISEVGQQQYSISKELGRLAVRNRSASAGDTTA